MPPPPRRPSRGQPPPPRRPSRGQPPRRSGAGRPDDEPRRPRLPEPELPGEVNPRELDRDARSDLRSLPPSLADRVASHLIAAGRALDDDPTRAHAHAWYARSLAPRLATVREAAGVTAYRVGDFAAALAELRAVRRMTGDPAH